MGFDIGFCIGFDKRFCMGFDMGFCISFGKRFCLGFEMGFDMSFDIGFEMGFCIGFDMGGLPTVMILPGPHLRSLPSCCQHSSYSCVCVYAI